MFSNLIPLINNRYKNLALMTEPSFRQFKTKSFFVYEFQESWPKVSMNLYCASYDSVGDRVNGFLRVSVSPWRVFNEKGSAPW